MNDEQREFVETICTSGDALLTLINEILDFSKIEADCLELENYSLNLRQCLEDALDIVAPYAVGKPIDLIYEIDPLVPEAVIGDAARLRQVLVNLVSNAIKFTDQGEVVIRIHCAGLPAQEGASLNAVSSGDPGSAHAPTGMEIGDAGKPCEILISVRDTGIGIPEDHIHRLFQSFSQIDLSTTRKYGGTGLGLAITRRLVELMGGKVTLESEPGIGFNLPGIHSFRDRWNSLCQSTRRLISDGWRGCGFWWSMITKPAGRSFRGSSRPGGSR